MPDSNMREMVKRDDLSRDGRPSTMRSKMNDLILDSSLLQARPLDFWPIQIKGQQACPACMELFFGSGALRLTYVLMSNWFLVTPELIRIAAPTVVNIKHLHEGLAIGGTLRNALIDLRCAAIIDRGIMAACGDVKNELLKLNSHHFVLRHEIAGGEIIFGRP